MAPQGQKIDELFWDLGANTAPLVAGVAKAKTSIAGLAKNVLTLRGGLITLGVVGALAFLKATSAAAKLDKPLREVSTLIPQTVEDMKDLRNEIIALSTRVPQPPEQLTKGLYQVISAGVTDTAEAMDVLEVAATAATAGLSTSQDAVLAITTVLNAFQLESSEAARVSDIFFKTIAQGVITFPEIASSIGDMATTAAQAGVSVEEMGAALAAMTKAGISANEATTALNKLFIEIIGGKLGEEFDLSSIAADGFAGTMNKLEEATRGDIKALKAIVLSEEAFRAASVLAGNQNAEFNRILGETSDAQDATKIAFDKMNGSLEAQSELLKNRVNAFFLELGAVTLPIVILAVKTLNQLLGATDFEAPAAGAEALAEQIDTVNNRVNELRGNITRLQVRTTAQRIGGLGLEPGDIDNLREAREELDRLIVVRARFLEEQTRRRAAAPPVRVGGVEQISEEIQDLRDELATQLQDELVAITATAVDDMELEFERLKEVIIKAFGEIPEEWKAVLEEMTSEIDRTLTTEVLAATAKLREDLARLRRGFGDVSAPVAELEGDVDDLAGSVGLLTRAFAELGQGFGLFGRDAASAINSLVSVAQGVGALKDLGKNISLSSAAGPIGLIAGGLASLFGGGGETERARILKANNEALDRLTKAMEASAAKGAITGGLVGAGISAIGGATQFPDIPFGGVGARGRVAFEREVEASLLAAGFTMEQLTDLAEQWDITLDGSLRSWTIFQEALQEVETANLFEGFAGGMRRMRIEWELTDTIDPVKRLADARKEFEKLSGIAAPQNAEEILDFWNRLQAGDVSVLGDLSPNQLIEFLQLFEGLLDETAGAAGATTSFAVSRSITEVTGNRIAGILTTDVFWNKETALNTAGILDALGGTQGGLVPPTSVPTGIGDVTINVTGSTDPNATADAVADAFIDMVDRGLGERSRDRGRSVGHNPPFDA